MRRRLRTVALIIGSLAAVTLLALALRDQFSAIHSRLHELSPAAVVAAEAAALLAGAATMLSWRALLTDLGSHLAPRASAQVFFVGQLGKYIPGGVWSVVGQMELARAHQVPRSRSAASSAVALVVALLTGLLLAATLLPALAGDAVARYWPVFLAAPVALVALYPPVLNRLVTRALTLARRTGLEQPVSAAGVLRSSFWAGVAWIAWGGGIWILCRDLGDGGGRAFAVSVGGFALAWCAGFLVLFVPAGAGVREVVLVAVLSSALRLPDGAPLLVALVSRLTLTVSDLLLGAAVLPGTRRARRRPEQAGRPAQVPREPAGRG